MKVIRAEALGMCFGVRDALQIAESIARPRDVAIHGELVHNEVVIDGLRNRGFNMQAESERDRLPAEANVLITAHGISDFERRKLESHGKRLIDTTCPLVHRAHEAATRLAREGFHVLVIGRAEHVEVRGLVGDLVEYDILESVDDVKTWPQRRLGIVCQTTTPPRDAAALRRLVERKNPHAEIRYVNTICQPTVDRQHAVQRLLPQVDAVVVVGGKNSNNTRQLAELCRDGGVPAFHVQRAADLDARWFRGCETVGLAAGTSTLDATIDEIAKALQRLRQHESTSGRLRSSIDWCRHFRNNAASRRQIPWETVSRLTDGERRAVARSVQVFQRGESGEGRHLLRCTRTYAERTGDAAYVTAVTLFIREEQRHAADLGRFLDEAAIPRIAGNWSDALFRWLRHRAGLELTIAVLVTAEILAKVYYAALRDATDCRALRVLCEQILCDEVAHVQFQCEQIARLRAAGPRWKNSLKRFFHACLYAGTMGVVWLSHARTFRRAGMGFRTFCRRAWREFRQAAAIMRREPV